VLEDVEIAGRTIARGEPVLVCIGSANRDPAQFSDPDRLDLTRGPNGHLSFGHGPLTCIGSWLARIEGQIAIASIAHRLRRVTVENSLSWRRNPPVLRGLESLVILFSN
jgi:hypothetical protein